MSERIDELLARALSSGEVPADATAAERIEIESLVGNANALRAHAARLDAQALAAMPTARARFQRHIAAAEAASLPAPRVTRTPARSGLFGRLGFGRGMTIAASAAVIAIVVLISVFATQSFDGTKTASALTKDDYVQISGVVSNVSDENGQRTVTVQSLEFGDLEVALSDLTSVVNDETTVAPSTIKAGDSLLIGGVVTRDNKTPRIAAKTLAISRMVTAPVPQHAALKELRDAAGGIDGTVTVFAISADGGNARVVLDAGNGEIYVVKVGPDAVTALLNNSGTAVGVRVRIAHAEGAPDGVFSLARLVPPSPPPGRPGVVPPGRRPDAGQSANGPSFVRVGGVLTGRDGTTLQVTTDSGIVQVVIRAHTHILAGDSGLTLKGLLNGETAIGYPLVAAGGIDPASGRVVADLIVFGAKTAE